MAASPIISAEEPSEDSDPDTVVLVLDSPAEAAFDEIISDTAAMELIGALHRSQWLRAARDGRRGRADRRRLRPSPRGFPSVLVAVRVLGDQVSGRLEVIQAMVERELRAEMTRERVVDRLHAELQEYKQDLLLKVMRPLFVDLIQLHDDIGKMQEAAGEAGPEGETVRPLLDSIRTGIEDILYRQGVEPFEQEQGAFDARRQRAVTTVPTEDPELNKTIAARLRKGFQAGEKVIRPEVVSVYTLKK